MNELYKVDYIIKLGDTIYSLSNKYNTSIKRIVNDNLAIDPYSLRVGQIIYIYPNCN